MWIVIGAVALFILYFIIKKTTNKASSDEAAPISTDTALEVKTEAPVVKATEETKEEKPAAKKAESAAGTSEYATQYGALSSSYKNAKAFTLFDTDAAFFSNEGDKTVTLLSITAFVKGAAKTESYGSYTFNLIDWAWDGDQPKGCAAEVKKHLSENFKKGETA